MNGTVSTRLPVRDATPLQLWQSRYMADEASGGAQQNPDKPPPKKIEPIRVSPKTIKRHESKPAETREAKPTKPEPRKPR
jgi:hypothetical protein